MKHIGLTISSLFMAVANRLMDFLWITLGLAYKDKNVLVVILLVMGILRILFFLFGTRPFKQINFYGKYIIGLTAAFIIILIATKSQDSNWVILMVILNELYAGFKNVGDANAMQEIFEGENKQITAFRMIKWLAVPLAAILLVYYQNMLSSIYAPLAVLIGLSMIILYNRFSKNYAKGALITGGDEILNSTGTLIISIFCGLITVLIYALLIWVKGNALLYLVIAGLLGFITELLSRKVNKKNVPVYEGIGILILAIIRYVV